MKLFRKWLKADPAKTATPSAEEETPPSADAISTSPSKGKILVVDDDLVVVKALALKLQANGYQVVSANEGADAVSMVRQERPDLVIVDVNFPPEVGMSWDGFKIVEWFRGRTEGGGVPVIIITGEASARNKERATAIGAVGFLQKPINMEELLTTIREILAESGGDAPAAA